MPSAHRIVAELVALGILERDSDCRLHIGIRLWEIVVRSSEVPTIREIALPYMEDLRSVVDAPTLLSVLDRNDVLNVETLSARQQSITNVTQPGVRLPALASSPGIILLAFAPPNVREHVLASAKITRFTDHTAVDRRELAQIVNEARRLRYAVARRWITPDSTGIAVPILADDGTAVAALSVTTPSEVGVPWDLLLALQTTARGISRAILVDDQPADPRVTLLMRRIRHATEIR